MNRRRFLGSVGTGVALFAGCTGAPSGAGSPPTSDTPTAEQSGSGHPCESPRNIDYDAVETYRPDGVYLTSAAESVHTACVTVTKASPEREETAGEAPPLSHRGYEMHPDTAVEIFRFREAGTYTIEVRLDAVTERATVERSASDLEDGAVTFEIRGPETVRVDRGDA